MAIEDYIAKTGENILTIGVSGWGGIGFGVARGRVRPRRAG
jgi:hypothetical protein